MNDPSRPFASEQTWEQGWDGHEREQLKRLSKLSLPQKLAWLEEAHRLLRQLQNGRRQADDTASAGK